MVMLLLLLPATIEDADAAELDTADVAAAGADAADRANSRIQLTLASWFLESASISAPNFKSCSINPSLKLSGKLSLAWRGGGGCWQL